MSMITGKVWVNCKFFLKNWMATFKVSSHTDFVSIIR